MMWLAGLVGGLVLLGSVLALAESSISRMSRVRAVALRQRGPPERRPARADRARPGRRT